MKKMIFILVIAVLAIVGVLFFAQVENQEDSVVYKVVKKSQQNIQQRFNLTPAYFGITMHGKHLEELCLAFNTDEVLSLDQLGPILIASAEEVIETINSNPNAYEILNEPFTLQNVQIIIHTRNARNRKIDNSEICQVRIAKGKLAVTTNDRKDEGKYRKLDSNGLNTGCQVLIFD